MMTVTSNGPSIFPLAISLRFCSRKSVSALLRHFLTAGKQLRSRRLVRFTDNGAGRSSMTMRSAITSVSLLSPLNRCTPFALSPSHYPVIVHTTPITDVAGGGGCSALRV